MALFVGPLCLQAAPETLLRYRATDGFHPGTSASVPGLTSLSAVERIARGSQFGLSDFLFAPFREGHGLAFAPMVSGSRLEEGFTVVAHVSPVELAGRQTLFAMETTADEAVFRFGWEDGALFAEISDQESAAPLRIESDEPLEAGLWYRLVYRYEGPSGGEPPRHSLWINERKILAVALPRPWNFSSGTFSARLGEDLRFDPGDGGHLLANVHAVSLESYPLPDFFLESPLIRDGSAYFGALEFHDYIGDGTAATRPLERRIHQTYFLPNGAFRYPALNDRLAHRWMLPFQNDSFIVQGLAADAAGRRVFIALYHRTVNDVAYTYPSIIAEVLLPDGRLGNVFVLTHEDGRPFAAHVGGIAYWDGLLFVPGPGRGAARDPDLFVFDVSDIPASAFDPHRLTGFAPVPLPVSKMFRDPLAPLGPGGRFNSLSFMDIHLDAEGRVLLSIGNFQESTAEPIHTFEVVFPTPRNPMLINPVTVRQSARRAQGVAFYFDVQLPSGRARCAFLSTSFGNNDSILFSSTYLGNRVDPVASAEFLRLPAGLEDLSRAGRFLFAQSESGGRFFQKRSANPWTQTFPFLFAIDIADQLDTNGNGIPDEWYARHGILANVPPTEDLDGDGSSIALEFAWDTNPRDPSDKPWAAADVTVDSISLPTSRHRFYTLEMHGSAEGWTPVEGWIRRRGTGGRLLFPLNPDQNALYRILVEVD